MNVPSSELHNKPEVGFPSNEDFSRAIEAAKHASPSKLYGNPEITVAQIQTPMGALVAGATEEGLCLLEFMDPKRLERQIGRLCKRLDAGIVPGEHPLFYDLQAQLDAYFNRKLQNFDIPLDPRGTPFQMAVWNALLDIPYGETRSYTDQANAIGMLEALRAVASANGENRIAILIPCHRVIGKNGSLTGYGGGLWRKEFLLHLEGAPEQLSLDGMG